MSGKQQGMSNDDTHHSSQIAEHDEKSRRVRVSLRPQRSRAPSPPTDPRPRTRRSAARLRSTRTSKEKQNISPGHVSQPTSSFLFGTLAASDTLVANCI